ncbi:hypothetical protein M9H77_02080 [Catharanthus roseus]|uniref:Uncharacterized protein n=1 Tax=Catharanthus roseus TaxID=4058 RepID=A0ACC0C7S5_CATRO|nr:hypothetical protein M9H77_02080 [Catharanthus roseus]
MTQHGRRGQNYTLSCSKNCPIPSGPFPGWDRRTSERLPSQIQDLLTPGTLNNNRYGGIGRASQRVDHTPSIAFPKPVRPRGSKRSLLGLTWILGDRIRCPEATSSHNRSLALADRLAVMPTKEECNLQLGRLDGIWVGFLDR